MPDEGILSVFASSDGSLWIGYGEKSFLVRIKNGKIKSFAKQKKAAKNGSVLGFHEHNKHIYLAQNDGITVISPEGKFKTLTNKIVSDTMMSYWTVDFFTKDNKVYATSVIRGVNEVVIRDKDVVFKNVYKGEFLYSSFCSDNNLILTFDPESKLFDADKFLSKQNQKPIKTLSSRRPATFQKDKFNNIYGGCNNMNFGFHGLIKLDANFNEELILREEIVGQELYYDEANNEMYFGTGYGLFIVNASLYAKTFDTTPDLKPDSFITGFPIENGVVALSMEGLVQLDDKNRLVRQITLEEMFKAAMQTKTAGFIDFQELFMKQWKNKAFTGIHLEDLKLINNKWVIFSRIGFFIINQQFKIESFVAVPASFFNFSLNGEWLFDQNRFSFSAWNPNESKAGLYDSFRQDKLVIKKLMGLENLGGKTVLVSMNQGALIYENKSLKKLNLKGLNYDVYRSASFQNKYLVISTVKGDILFYDSERNFELTKTLGKMAFNNESILDLKANKHYLVFITSKRVFIWDGKELSSYSEYQNPIDHFNRVNLNGKRMSIYNAQKIIRIEVPQLLNEINKKIVFNVTNRFNKQNEPIFNTSHTFSTQSKTLFLQFLTYNELEKDVLKGYYKLADNAWIEIEPSGKIYLQNLDFGSTKIEFKINDLRTGKTTWQHIYNIEFPAPWYLHGLSLFIYFLLCLGGIVILTRYFALQSKKKEIEKLTFKNRFNELQMEALQSQMNPHFVFNALNSVQKYILDIDQERALSFLNQFSILIRRVLDYSDTKLISIEEELEFIQLYLSIENQRFQGALYINQKVDCDELTMIPPLLIQPLIENAIIYGLRSELGEIFISISIKQEEKSLRIKIKNEINSEVIKNHTFQSKSTEIIQKRLALYDAKATLTTTTEDSFFTATILLPITDK